MDVIKLNPIGKIETDGAGARIVLAPAFRAGLKGLSAYSHVQVLWWMDKCDNPRDRNTLAATKPYKKGPERLGVFAMRSPERPNPIAVTNAAIAYVDEDAGTVGLHWIDAFPGSAVLDLKPYTPSIDRVERPSVPVWCRHWPKSFEESADFDWAAEFNF
jgi:tRNA (Thr-GGU) A37 N-methylase